jgi:glycosyltransferase involved in cell wall biosynthesis
MNAATPSRVAVVTPVFEDRAASTRLFRELHDAIGESLFVVAVDDGSVREPVEISALAGAAVDGVVIRLRRNVGHQRAIAIGLSWLVDHVDDVARIVVMDSDGEDLPASISPLGAALDSADVDIVVAERRSRVETFRFRAFYAVYRWLFHLLSGRAIRFGNFMAMKPAAARRLVAMHELWIHVAACVLGSKLRVATCALDRGPRYAGRSKMNFVGLVLHGFRALMVFADDVLVRVGIACAAVAALSVLGGIAAVVLKLIGIATPGWFSVAFGILLLMFLQTGAITLMTLMLAGVARGAATIRIEYRDFIDEVLVRDAQ